MGKRLSTIIDGAACYHAWLASNPEKALEAPAWRRLTNAAQTRWRERAAGGSEELHPLMEKLQELTSKLKGQR